MKKSVDEVIEYTRDKKIAAPDSLILDGETIETPSPIKEESNPQQEFSWSDDADCVVVSINRLRQEDFWGDRDQVVYFLPEYADAIAKAILALAKGLK